MTRHCQTISFRNSRGVNAALDRYADFHLGSSGHKLGLKSRQIMLGAGEVFVSAASIWEIAIKAKIGKLEGDPDEFVEAIEESGFRELMISAKHAAKEQRFRIGGIRI